MDKPKKIIINVSGGCLQTIRANFPLNIDEIAIFDEDVPEYLNEAFEISDKEIPSKQEVDDYWENNVTKEYAHVIY